MTNVEWPLPQPDSLGPNLGADDVADAVVATLDEWTPFYVAMISGRVTAAGKIGGRSQPTTPLAPFGHWINEDEYRNVGTGRPAGYEVRVPATVGEPRRKGSGLYVATWRVQVNVQYWGTDWQESRDGTSWYEKATRWSILQHRSLGGFANSTTWKGTSFQRGGHSSSRTEGIAVIGFDVEVLDSINDTRGPATVPAPPLVPDQDPTVATTSVTLTNAGTGPLPSED
jgi:hypothetical protein